jgi:4-hydroxy-tetrahydrodipicolinate reductase
MHFNNFGMISGLDSPLLASWIPCQPNHLEAKHTMQVLIVGSGKLATELLNELCLGESLPVCPWLSGSTSRTHSIVVHAGSGRELEDACCYCRNTGSVLLELSTGSPLEISAPDFPVILCPNTNILMLKFMNMLAKSGGLFKDYRIALTESHQAGKRSAPGTAIAIAQSLGLPAEDVVSIRNREEQLSAMRIPPEHLERHAVHSINIADGACSIDIETRVFGDSPYAEGVSRIIAAAASHPLENRLYEIDEFIERGWI